MPAPNIHTQVALARRAVQVLAGDPELRGVAAAIDLWLSGAPGEALTFEAALGWPASWRTDTRRAARDEALRALAQRLCPGLAGREAARTVAAAASRYEAAGWLRDRRTLRRPDGVEGLVFDALSAGGLPGPEKLRRLFAAG